MFNKITIALVFSLFLGLCQAQSLSELRSDKRFYEKELSKQRLSMTAYMWQHKAATTAVVAAGGGLASFLTENMDENARTVFTIAGIVGAFYCIDNVDECATVTLRLSNYYDTITEYQKKLDRVNQKLALQNNNSSLYSYENSGSPSVKGSDIKGPEYSSRYPYGIYNSYGNDIKLIFSKEYVTPATGYGTPYVSAAKKVANKATSKLHNTTTNYLYTLLERGQQLTLKFSSSKNGDNSQYGYLVIYRSTKSGNFFSLNNDEDEWVEMKIGVTINPHWYIGDSKIMIRAVRPTYNADNKGREIDYRFILSKK